MRFLIPIVLALATGCAPATVNTVQPGAIDKSALDGEWYWRDTVAKVPYGTAATFTGAQTSLERITWVIQEDLLLGLRSYENVEGSTTEVNPDGSIEGTPVLAYAIERHFDIRRSYDPRTGEESNVVMENVERPWYDREFIRVDWSTNLADVRPSFAGVPLQVLDYGTTDPAASDAPSFDDSDGDGVVDHLSFTSTLLAQPDALTLPGYGDIPVCWFYGQAEYDCGSVEIDMHSDFMKVPRTGAYEGIVWDDHWMETFGLFLTDRLSYDRAYGLLQPNVVRWANRHDLWEHTYVTDAHDRPLCEVDGVTDLCISFAAEDNPVALQVPIGDRVLKPIAYHAGPDFPDDLRATMDTVAEDWNVPFRDVVNGVRFWACMDEGGKKKDCEPVIDDSLQAFVWCENNPSLPGDPVACNTDHTGPSGRPDGVPDLVVPGDLRYNIVHIVDNPLLSSPFGYGPSAADPAGRRVQLADGTLELGPGEIISGQAFVYGHVLDRIAHQTADLVQLINGEIDPDAFVEGENITAWIDAMRDDDPASMVGATSGVPEVWDSGALQARLGKMHNGFADAIRPGMSGAPLATTPANAEALLEHASNAMDASGAFGAGIAEGLANFERLEESPWDELLWNAESIGSYGFDPLAISAADVTLTDRSPLDLVSPAAMAEREAMRILAGQHAVDLDDGAYENGSMLGLALRYAELELDYDAIVDDVKQNLFREVVLHEIGHTVGLRHNFAGSWDAFNFSPTYWDLRDDGDMGPRHVDPETNHEVTHRIREFQYSSIMDYGGSRNTGWHGLGHHDLASIKFSYGQLVEVLTEVPEEEVVQGLPNDVALGFLSTFNTFTSYPSVVLNYNNGSFVDLHYTDFHGIAGDLQARSDVPLHHLASTNEFYEGFAGMLQATTTVRGIVEEGDPAVPYRFCSDEFAIGLTCARFDEGADPYEAQQFLMERYWNDYLFTNFARQRYGFGDASSYVSRQYSRTFSPLRQWERYYALFHGVFDVDSAQGASDFFAADRGFGGWTAATDESFRFLTRIIARPEPGSHVPVARGDGHITLQLGTASSTLQRQVEVPLGMGAYFESQWDSDSGYHWFERQERIGTYWDRMLALMALTYTDGDGFLGVDTAVDPRRYAIGFQDLYRDPIALYLARLMSDDVTAIAPLAEPDGGVLWPDPMNLAESWPPDGRENDAIDPAAYWLVRYDAGLFGKALLSRGYDRSFLNRGRIYIEGSGEALTPPDAAGSVHFTDPFSGKTYTAWSFLAIDDTGALLYDDHGQPIELGSGARMVGAARELGDRCTGLSLDEPDPDSRTQEMAESCAALEAFASDLDLQLQLYETFDSIVP